MSKNKGKIKTRVSSEHFLVGQEKADLGADARQGKLPLTKNVLQYLFHLKNLPENKFKSVSKLVCCPMKTGTRVASCEENCICVVNRVKNEGNWVASGLPMVTDQSIMNKIVGLNEEFKALDKNKTKSGTNIAKREKFISKLNGLFDISAKDAINLIKNDRLRKDEDKNEDVAFLEDQRDQNQRKMCVGKLDKNYEKAVQNKAWRAKREERVVLKVSDNPGNNNEIENDEFEECKDKSDKNDEDFKVPEQKTKKANTVTITLPRKRLAQETAVTAKRHKLSITAQRDMLANIINVGGGDVSEFSISNKTVRTAGAEAISDCADKIKSNFKKYVKEELGGITNDNKNSYYFFSAGPVKVSSLNSLSPNGNG